MPKPDVLTEEIIENLEIATLVLEHYVRLTPRNGKYSEQPWSEREDFIEKFFSLRAVG